MGIAFLTKSIVHKELKSGELISIPVRDKNFKRKYYMIYHSEKYATDACKTINSDERTKRLTQDFKLVKVEIKEV